MAGLDYKRMAQRNGCPVMLLWGPIRGQQGALVGLHQKGEGSSSLDLTGVLGIFLEAFRPTLSVHPSIGRSWQLLQIYKNFRIFLTERGAKGFRKFDLDLAMWQNQLQGESLSPSAVAFCIPA